MGRLCGMAGFLRLRARGREAEQQGPGGDPENGVFHVRLLGVR